MALITTTVFQFLTLLTLTSTTLAAPSLPTTSFQKRFDFQLNCNDNGGGYRPVSEAETAVNYLYLIGESDCTIDGENTIFAYLKDTAIYGANVSESGTTTSLCKHVARAAQNVIDSCTTADGYVGGASAAYGNGDLLVSINRNTGV
ncbi:hypothetical protein BJX70DRAFT_393248 [Aspergillus crustosus]